LHYQDSFAAVEAILAAGFLVTAPGLEEGEHKEVISHVVKREKENQDGSQTTIVDLYPAGEARYSFLSVYLNSGDQVAAFEYASGLSVGKLPLYVGAGKIERGANKKSDALIIPTPSPFSVVWKLNPKYNPDETDATKKKPKRLFVRWDKQKSEQAQISQPEQQQPTPVDVSSPEAVKAWVPKACESVGLSPATVSVGQSIDSWDDYSQAILAVARENKVPTDYDSRILSFARYRWFEMMIASAGPSATAIEPITKQVVSDSILGGAAKSQLVEKMQKLTSELTPW
jgi:hypothetical protein